MNIRVYSGLFVAMGAGLLAYEYFYLSILTLVAAGFIANGLAFGEEGED